MAGYQDNAVMAKARALYGKRLKQHDYDELVYKKTVGEIAGYLKNETCYAKSLAEVREDLIHRGQLEYFVRRRVRDVYSALRHYAANDALFMRMLMMENDILQILTVIRLYNSGELDKYIVSLPVFLDELTSFELFDLAKAKSFDGLLEALRHSEYYNIVGQFRPARCDDTVDITAVEAQLLTYFYNRIAAIAKNDYPRATSAEIISLLAFRVRLHNISVILRMRRHSDSSEKLIRSKLVRFEGDQNLRLYEKLLFAEDVAAIEQILQERGTPFKLNNPTAMYRHLKNIQRQFHLKLYHFSCAPVSVVISYTALLEIEINNIVFIIEGVRYHLSPAEIRNLLTF